MPKQSRRALDPILTAEELIDLQQPSAVDAMKEARRKARRLKERRLRRHRLRLVDDIIARLLGHRGANRRLHESATVLAEGGHMFVDAQGQPLTQRIKQADIAPTVAWLETISGLDLHGPKSKQDGLPSHWLGSTGRKADSGDLDLMVDETTISKDDLIQRLTKWAAKQQTTIPQYIRKSGINVHFLTPIKGNPKNGYVQTDFMFVSNPEWSQFVLQAPPNSAYKGAYRAQMMNSLAKALGMKMNQSEGIKDRATERVISANPDKVAKLLLNPKATRADLASVETMLAALKNDPKRDAKLETIRQVLAKDGMKLQEASLHAPVSEAVVGKEATDFEELIADALTQLAANPAIKKKDFQFTPNSAASTVAKVIRNKEGVAWQIATDVLKSNKKAFSKKVYTRAGGTKPIVSRDYIAYGGTDQTSKADIVSEDGTIRFSVKEGSGAFLGSPESGALRASFEFALHDFKKSGKKFSGADIIRKVIKVAFETTPPPKDLAKWVDLEHATTQTADGGRATDKEKNEILRKTNPKDATQPKLGWLDAAVIAPGLESVGFPRAIAAYLENMLGQDDAIKSGLTDAFNKVFSENDELRQRFVYQEASGLGKFGGRDAVLGSAGPAGSANYFLSFDKGTGNAKVQAISTDAEFIGDLSKRVRFRFRWRGKIGVVRMALDIINTNRTESHTLELTTEEWVRQEWDTYQHALLREGVMDTIAGWGTRVKTWLQNLQTKFLSLFDSAAQSGPDAMLDLMDMELEGVDIIGE